MAITYISKGNMITSITGPVVTAPTSYQDNDLFILAVMTANQAISAPSGWTEISSPGQGTGTAGVAGGVRIQCFYKYASGTLASLTLADSGDVTAGVIGVFRGVKSYGTPYNVVSGAVDASAVTNLSCPAVTTTVDNCMILNFIGLDRDAASTANMSVPTNTNLSDVTELFDQVASAGSGGGVGLISGIKGTAGDTGNTTATGVASTTHAYLTIALLPIEGFSGVGIIDAASTVVALGKIGFSGIGIIDQTSTVVGLNKINFSGVGVVNQNATVVTLGKIGFKGIGVVDCSSVVTGLGKIGFKGVGVIDQPSTVAALNQIGLQGVGSISQTSSVEGLGVIGFINRSIIDVLSSIDSENKIGFSNLAIIDQTSTVVALGHIVIILGNKLKVYVDGVPIDGILKYWDGLLWVSGIVKWYDGTEFV